METKDLVKKISSEIVETKKEGLNKPESFSPKYTVVRDYFNLNPITCRSCSCAPPPKCLSDYL